MTTLVIGPGDVAAALREHGFVPTPVNPETREPYVYCLALPNNADLMFADSVSALIDGLIPGYNNMSEADAAEARILTAAHAAAVLQAQAIASLTAEEFNDLDEADIVSLLAPRIGPDAAQADWWRPSIPLYVVDTSYEPYTQLPRPASPTSNIKENSTIMWISPNSEEELVLSLHEAGYVRLMENHERVSD